MKKSAATEMSPLHSITNNRTAHEAEESSSMSRRSVMEANADSMPLEDDDDSSHSEGDGSLLGEAVLSHYSHSGVNLRNRDEGRLVDSDNDSEKCGDKSKHRDSSRESGTDSGSNRKMRVCELEDDTSGDECEGALARDAGRVGPCQEAVKHGGMGSTFEVGGGDYQYPVSSLRNYTGDNKSKSVHAAATAEADSDVLGNDGAGTVNAPAVNGALVTPAKSITFAESHQSVSGAKSTPTSNDKEISGSDSARRAKIRDKYLGVDAASPLPTLNGKGARCRDH